MGILWSLETFGKSSVASTNWWEFFSGENRRLKKVTHILKGTKYSYDRQNVVWSEKAFNYNQMFGYVEYIYGNANQISIYIWPAYWWKIIRPQWEKQVNSKEKIIEVLFDLEITEEILLSLQQIWVGITLCLILSIYQEWY